MTHPDTTITPEPTEVPDVPTEPEVPPTDPAEPTPETPKPQPELPSDTVPETPADTESTEGSGLTWEQMNEIATVQEQLDFLPSEVTTMEEAVKEGNVYITAPNFTQSTAAIAGIVEDMHTVLNDPAVETTDSLIKLK